MARSTAIEYASEYFDSGRFLTDLRRRVAFRTASEEAGSAAVRRAYLTNEIVPSLHRFGCTTRIVENSVDGRSPFLLANRQEGHDLPTVLTYGHGDVVRGHDSLWRAGLRPWEVAVEGERLYGRGAADNKGQHTINLAALEHVLRARDGKLGFNLKILFDMGEEVGSPGLDDVCVRLRDALAADVLIASDGMRVAASRPTIFLGTRGVINFTLQVRLRDDAYHSGNWGGLLRNPATVLANALAALVDERGRVRLEALRPPAIPDEVRRALSDVHVDAGPDSPDIDVDWGEPDMTPNERVFGWNALEVLAFTAGTPAEPANAIPGSAIAYCQLRFVVGTDWQNTEQILREHLDRHGFPMVDIRIDYSVPATRLDPRNDWVRWAIASVADTTGVEPAVLPNLGGTLPNESFAETLALPTIWIPHSYPACLQHAANEHLLAPVVREALQMMSGLFWDLGELARGTASWKETLSQSSDPPIGLYGRGAR